jgi:hypothetical protein
MSIIVITIRRELAIVLLLLQLLSSITGCEKSILLADSVAFVHALKTAHVKHPVSTQLKQHRLSLETSPLIGGPSWLPLHVKVVLRSQDLYHQWDLIPIDATNTTTLQKLVTLQHVPAQIRHRIYATTLPQNEIDPTSPQHELVRTEIYDAYTLLDMPDNVYLSIDNNAVPKEKNHSLTLDAYINEEDQLYIVRAHRFCQSFMIRTNMELHLIWNNCWTFAVQLVLYLLVRSYDETMID